MLQGCVISLRVSAELLFTRRHGYCVSLAGHLPHEDPFSRLTGRAYALVLTGVTAGRAKLLFVAT